MINREKALILHPEAEKKLIQERMKIKVKHKAHELYVRSGRIPGNDLTHWLEAEKLVKKEMIFY